MSRKVINVLFIIGSCVYIPGMVLIIYGYIALFQVVSTQSTYYSNYSSTSSSDFSTFIGLFLVGALIAGVGGILVLVARIGALIESGKAQEWLWFVLILIFGWIVLLIYLLVGPKPRPALQYAAYPYAVPGQPWPGYPPGMMPPPAQSWTGYPPQAPGMMPPPAQPWPSYPPPAE